MAFKTADWISGVRLALDYSQEEFARAVGVAQGQVSRWENGKDLPRPEKIEAINRLAPDSLKVEVGEIILAHAGIAAPSGKTGPLKTQPGRTPLDPGTYDADLMAFVLEAEVARLIDYEIGLADKDNAKKFVARVLREYQRLAGK